MDQALKKAVEVSPRTIYEFGKRKRRVFDARLVVEGEPYTATAASKAEAVAAVVADVQYVREAGRIASHGCALFPQGKESWVFKLPSGGSMCFGATDLAAALARVAHDYREHEGCKAFFEHAHMAYYQALAADRAWSLELRYRFGDKAGDVRYTKRAEGEPGSELRRLYEAKIAADHALVG